MRQGIKREGEIVPNIARVVWRVVSCVRPEHGACGQHRVRGVTFFLASLRTELLAYPESTDEEVTGICISRKARRKRTFLGMFDVAVAGSLPNRKTPFECLVREAAGGPSLPQ